MNKELIKVLAIFTFAVVALATSAWAMAPVFPGFYNGFLEQGFSPVMAFLYAVSSAGQAARWVAVPLTLLVLPAAFFTRFLIRRFGK